MIQSEEVLVKPLSAIPQAMFLREVKTLKAGAKKDATLAKNTAPQLPEKATGYYVNKIMNKINKKLTSTKVSRIILINNKVKHIMKVLCFQKIEVLSSQEGGFLNFLRPLVTAGLTLMKSVLIPLAKIVLMSLGLTATMSATDTVIQKETDKSDRPSESASCKTA